VAALPVEAESGERTADEHTVVDESAPRKEPTSSAPEDPHKSEWAPPAPKSATDEMKIVTLQDLKELGHIPAKTEPVVKPLSMMGRKPIFVVYISHQWMQPEKGLPDSEDHIICNTIVEALESFKTNHLADPVTVCIWISYSCRPKASHGKAKATSGLEASLPYYISRSDAFMAVVADTKHPSRATYAQLPQAVEAQDLGHSAWCGHWSRAWQRLEVLLASTISRPTGTSDHLHDMPEWWTVQRGSPVSRCFMASAPGTGFSFMRPLSRNLLEAHCMPRKGEVNHDDDMAVIESILSALQQQLQPGEYTGSTDSEGRRHGHGTCEFVAGGKYTGEWVAGKMHGKGEYHFPWSDVYVGQFRNGKRHGDGEYTYASGNKYVGHFVDNQRHGIGRYSYVSGADYEGAFAFDKRHGHGTYTFPNGDVFEGDYVRGQIHGQGRLTKLDGSQYEGPWKDGQIHGHGIFTFASGAKYVGEYADGEMDGQGTFTFANGDVFRGQYKKGQMRKGVFLFANGDMYEGDFRNGKMHGSGVFRSSQGDLYEGEFANDLKHGAGVMVLSTGVRYEGEFQEGKKHGSGRTCMPEGEWYKSEWKNGKMSKSKTLLDMRQVNRASSSGPPRGNGESAQGHEDLSCNTSDWLAGLPAKQKQKRTKKVGCKKPARQTEPLLIQWSSSDMIHGDIVEEQVARCGAKQRRKGPIYVQKYPTTLPPDRSFTRRRPAPPSSATRPATPGSWVQQSSATSLLGVAGRYGIPQHLLKQLSIEAEAEGARRQRHTSVAFPGLRPSSAPSHTSHEGAASTRYPQSSDGIAPRSRPQSAVPRMQRGIQQEANRGGPEWDEALLWPPQPKEVRASAPRQQGSVASRSTRWASGNLRQGAGLSDPRLSFSSWNDSDPEMAMWLAQPGEQTAHSDPAETFTIGGQQSQHMNAREAAETGVWHPGIPKPSWTAPRPPIIRAADYHGHPSAMPRVARPGPYSRAHHFSLQSAAERA